MRPVKAGVRDFATAAVVWFGFGIVRSFFQRRTPVK